MIWYILIFIVAAVFATKASKREDPTARFNIVLVVIPVCTIVLFMLMELFFQNDVLAVAEPILEMIILAVTVYFMLKTGGAVEIPMWMYPIPVLCGIGAGITSYKELILVREQIAAMTSSGASIYDMLAGLDLSFYPFLLTVFVVFPTVCLVVYYIFVTFRKSTFQNEE